MQLTGTERLASALATAFARPSCLIAPELHVNSALLAKLGTGAAGTRATDHILRASLGLDVASFGAGFRERLNTSADFALACRLVLAPRPRALDLLGHLISQINQVRLRAAILKADRESYRTLLGEVAIDAAMRPAPALAVLTDLADPSLPVLRPAKPEDPAIPMTDQPLYVHAVALVGALLGAQDSLFEKLWTARRFAQPADQQPRDLTPAQRRAAWRLIEMRLQN